MKASNIKDRLSTICGIWIALVVAFKTQGITLSPNVDTILEIGSVVSVVLLGYLQGKNHNGTTKVIDPSTGQQDADPNAVKK